jgi:hypothetical protein
MTIADGLRSKSNHFLQNSFSKLLQQRRKQLQFLILPL